eukprot:6187184-Pleurochrysis_carterae.AAC.1
MPSSCSSFAVAQARMQGVCVQDVEGDEGYLIHTEALFTACTRDSRHILPRFEAMPALNQCLAFGWEKGVDGENGFARSRAKALDEAAKKGLGFEGFRKGSTQRGKRREQSVTGGEEVIQGNWDEGSSSRAKNVALCLALYYKRSLLNKWLGGEAEHICLSQPVDPSRG